MIVDNSLKNHSSIGLDYNNMMSEFIGDQGIKSGIFDSLMPKIENAIATMAAKKNDGTMDWRNLPYNQNEIVEEISSYAQDMKDKFETFVVLGIGGSALGPLAVQQAINHPYYNEISKEKRNGFPKFYVVDNVDPERLSCLFDVIDITKTLFNCITKSGSTSETMSQFMIIKEMLEQKLGKDKAKENIVCTTDEKNGNLIKIAKEEGYKTFYVPDGVGGRFSQLCPVGLLPAAMTGIDIKLLLQGAEHMDKMCETKDFFSNPAYLYGVLSYISMLQGKNICVMMPYADSLKYISDWYAQLWAESLGKKYDNQGNIVYVGQTPVRALGVTDQHSQLQLYTEGPFDKVIVMLRVDKFKRNTEIPKTYGDIPSLGFLGGVSYEKLIKTQQMATEYALQKSGRPNMTISLDCVNEFTVGQLLYMFEMATGFVGELLNINAFDQPGVEEGKNATYAMFDRPGYEHIKEELENSPKKKSQYMV